MAHDSVSPQAGEEFLPVTEVLQRLMDAFPVHEFDQTKGTETAEQMIAKLEEMDAPAELVDSYRRRSEKAINCYVSDDGSEDAYLHFTLWPGEPIFLGYHSTEHEEAARPLLERLATALDYKIDGQWNESDLGY